MTRVARIAAAALLLLLAACQPLPLRTSLPVEVRPSSSFDERRPNYVILHHTGDEDAERALTVLTDPLAKVSSHYLIARDGTIFYLVDEQVRAWHAGESYWAGNRDLNSASLGIELVNNGSEPFPETQIAALTALLADIKDRYRIPPANFLGHGDVAPGRKVDPSRWFPWQALAAQGFGLWCDAPQEPVPGIDDTLLLGAFGYDVTNLDAAVAAFKRRFMPNDESSGMTDGDRAMLQCLLALRNGRQSEFW
jgi:N-acetylmuramoyl-L-alanine amidase